MDIFQLPAFDDNYLYVLKSGDQVAAVDPGDPQVILGFLEDQNLTLDFIFNTHHHWDHVGGNTTLKDKTGCQIIGFEGDKERIPSMDHGVKEGDVLMLGDTRLEVMETPGHTTGHISYFVSSIPALFCGDTLFSMGCGRVFEGDPETLWQSLQRIKQLPDETLIYCAHEYTENNARFAVSLDPTNELVQGKLESVMALRTQGERTVPSLLGEEKNLNPFLTAVSPELFAERRKLKDIF